MKDLKQYYFLILSIFLFGIAKGEKYDSELDSLLQVQKSYSKDMDTGYVTLLNKISLQFEDFDLDSAYKYGMEAWKLSIKLDFAEGQSKSLHNVATYFYYRAEYDSSIHYNLKAAKIARENDLKRLLARSYNNISVDYDELGDFEKAIDYALNTLKIYEELSDWEGMASAHIEIGSIYYQQNMYNKALTHFKEALKLDEKVGYKSGLGYDYGNIGTVFKNLNQTDSAVYYLRKAIEIRKELNEEHSLSFSYINLANVLKDAGKINEALDYYQKAMEMASKLNDKDVLTHLYSSLSAMYHQELKDYTKALDYAHKAYDISMEIKSPYRIVESVENLASIYEKTGDFEKANHYRKVYIEKNDSLVNLRNSKMMAELESKYENEKKQLQIQHLKKQQKVEQEKQQKQFIILIITIVGALVVVILLLIIYRRLKITRKQKRIIEEQKKRVDEVNEELNQTNEEILAQRDQIELQKNLIEEKHGEIQESINYARRIQTAILPPKSMLEKYLPQSFVLYKPKDVVAGDFYWLEATDEFIFFAVADCTGHGVPGAMVSVVCHGALNRCIREYKLTKPSDVLDKTRQLVIDTFKKSEQQVKDGMDISLCAIPKGSSKLSFAGANNPLYIVRNSADKSNLLEGEESIEIIKADKEPIGFVQHPAPFTNHELQLEQGDVLYLFSDGYADQFGGPKGKKMGYRKFRELLIGISNKEMERQQQILDERFVEWKEREEQIDDVCVVGIKFG